MVEAYQSDSEIGFRVPDSILWQVEEWERAIDERVFFEQLRTGRLVWHEGEIYPESFESMQKRYKKHGKIEPYYGCSGCSPSFQFQILPDHNHLTLTIKHGAMNDTVEFASIPISEVLDLKGARTFTIKGKELETLIEWEEWDLSAALSCRYIFLFFSGSLGGGVRINNTETGNEINATNYEDW